MPVMVLQDLKINNNDINQFKTLSMIRGGWLMFRKGRVNSTGLVWKQFRGWLGVVLFGICFLALMLGACSGGGSGSSGSTDGTDSGEVIVGLTDAESDFVKYEVDVVSLTLTKQNGAVVEALPVATRVDFAQYVDMTEFLTVATVPVGRYTKATLTLDYQNADIQVENAGGDAVPVETILDENNMPVTTYQASVHLQGRNSLLIAVGIPAHLTLDFDLHTSNHVEFDNGQPTMTVKPCLMADVNPENPKIHRLRGPLKEVNVDQRSFRVIIRPFIHIISGGDERLGLLNVVTDDSTFYHINGEKYQGSDGLVELDQQQILTAVVVVGDLNIVLRRFEARQVYAGSSVAGGTLDVMSGNVISRSDNQLTVKGATLIRAQGSVIFNDEMLVQVGDNTTVSRHLSKEAFGINDISVGQRITVFGELNSEETVLDADPGHVRLMLSTIKGVVVSTNTTVIVNLTAIDGRKVQLFDFSGTGSSGNEAVASAYEVDPGSLDITGLDPGTPVKFRGFVTPFGHDANVADFEARTMVKVSEVKGVLIVTWVPPSSDAIADLSENGFTLNLAGVEFFHHLNRAGVVIDLTGLDDPPFIEPKDDGTGLFQIIQDGSRQFYFTFDGFVDELSERLGSNGALTHILATGIFDDANSILTSDLVIVGLD
jgi:hypothetical protein